MKRNIFGGAKPASYDEMLEALADAPEPDTLFASVEFSDGDTEFDGWTATVQEQVSGDEVFSTLGYASKQELVSDLRSAGITEIQYMEE